MKRTWQRLGLVSAPGRVQSVPAPFHLSFQCRHDFSTTFPAPSLEAQDKPTRFHWKHDQPPIAAVRSAVRLEKEEKAKQRVGSPYSDHTKIYRHYLAAVNGQKDDPLPLEIHQAALRACTPSLNDIRVHTARLLQEKKLGWHDLTHPYEPRFQKIMQNIDDAGFNPSIEDYHIVMSQFAAAGHYAGISKYMRHMRGMGLEPDHRTFGYFLRAIAHRVSLPVPTPQRPAIIRRFVDITIQVLREMSDRRIPPSSTNVDLAFRILNEINDPKSLAESLKLGYGMDLDYLDSPPIDAASVSKSTADLSLRPLQFSTSTLNSLLETLGRWNQISKMVYVFETVTTPLPVPAKPDNTFDDDDDDFLPIQQKWKPPSAEPNTTTFNTLIKHCAEHEHSVLAKHYATWALHNEHMSTIRLREELRKKPLSEVAAPRVAINARTLQPILALASRKNDVQLLKWVKRISKSAVRLKYRSWTYYNQTRSKYESQPATPTSDTPPTLESSTSSSLSKTPPSKVSRPSTFSIGTHLYILRQDIASLSDIRWGTGNRLSNAITRSKARLGRRIWQGKDVYMRDKGVRMNVDPEIWKDKVNFRESKREVVKPKPVRRKRKRYSHVGLAQP